MRHILDDTWFSFLNDRHKSLVRTAVSLYEREFELKSDLEDYSFIVFPMSKAYEGFLKRSFYDLKLIDKKTFEGKRFRIGKALNPDVHEDQRDKYWLFDDLEKICGAEMARELWETWLECRNRVFHFFVNDNNTVSLEDAGNKLLKLNNAMKYLVECQIDSGIDEANVYDPSEKN